LHSGRASVAFSSWFRHPCWCWMNWAQCEMNCTNACLWKMPEIRATKEKPEHQVDYRNCWLFNCPSFSVICCFDWTWLTKSPIQAEFFVLLLFVVKCYTYCIFELQYKLFSGTAFVRDQVCRISETVAVECSRFHCFPLPLKWSMQVILPDKYARLKHNKYETTTQGHKTHTYLPKMGEAIVTVE
jgi:hypothetical protein